MFRYPTKSVVYVPLVPTPGSSTSLELSFAPACEQLACIDLSKGTRLKNVIFRCEGLNPKWIAMALQTITSKHRDLQQITIHAPYHRCPSTPESKTPRKAAGEDRYRQWMDLDSLLVQLLESRAIRTKVMHDAGNSERKSEMCEYMGSLLPKTAERYNPTRCMR